jgi:hypothetical protein
MLTKYLDNDGAGVDRDGSTDPQATAASDAQFWRRARSQGIPSAVGTSSRRPVGRGVAQSRRVREEKDKSMGS